jgi:tRNA threonylcarbamoyladenosine modification (KEOPS) complex  Pcc1 subunit
LLKAHIEIQFSSTAQAKQVFEAVVPDNGRLPAGLSIESNLDQNRISFEIMSTRGIDSFGATIEDLMSAIDLSIRTTEFIQK